MNDLQAGEFGEFFRALHGDAPFPWQERLAAQVCRDRRWPKAIDLPTASGKTACIDIALFALAVLGNDAPRRIFFVVDRRVIVNEAYGRAERIREKLSAARDGLLKKVADRLTALSGQKPVSEHDLRSRPEDISPIDVYQLRGGAYRDETWLRSPLQPIVITSTVDQVGSRVLFRGYGIRQETWPIHAGLIANDSLIFLDEAHCSKAFASTLEAVEAYRSETWAPSYLGRPFGFVEMTATPGRQVSEGERFGINDDDRQNEVLGKRLRARKKVRIPEPIKCRKEETGAFVKALLAEASSLVQACDGKRVAILVNRVVTAKAVHAELQKRGAPVHLVTGRMRPLDRDKQARELQYLKSGKERADDEQLQYVVSTQCLEVGADFDFDVLVSECASIDALLQRFGRLDRTGDFGNAMGAVLAASWQITGREGERVYGDSLKETWAFLGRIAVDGFVQMGIELASGPEKTVAEHLKTLSEDDREKMRLLTPSGPKLLPSHVDALVQTYPTPEQEPEVDLFLHGNRGGNPDVNVVWRSDLNDRPGHEWAKVVAVCPPTSLEAMPVPIWNFRNWFAGEAPKQAFQDESDLEVAAADYTMPPAEATVRSQALIWRGKDETIWEPRSADKFRPGDVVVLAESSRGWEDLGHIPEGYDIDLGDIARLQLRRSITVRLHPEVMKQWNQPERVAALESLLVGQEIDEDAVRVALREIKPMDLQDSKKESWWDTFVTNCTISRYPAGRGWVLEGYFGRAEKRKPSKVSLEHHLKDVDQEIGRMGGDLLGPEIKAALHFAARHHDYGKADIRFQTWLRGDRMAAELAPSPIAKSGTYVLKTQAECGLPDSFRHELLSLTFAEKSPELAAIRLRDLALHEIAAHHGYCRPFAPVVLDEEADCVEFGGLQVCKRERLSGVAHRLGSGISDRFWALTRLYGWWGLAYLEAILRLADWKASEDRKVEAADEY